MNQQGLAFITSVFLLLMLSVLSLGYYSNIQYESQETIKGWKRLQSYYLAKSGIKCAYNYMTTYQDVVIRDTTNLDSCFVFGNGHKVNIFQPAATYCSAEFKDTAGQDLRVYHFAILEGVVENSSNATSYNGCSVAANKECCVLNDDKTHKDYLYSIFSVSKYADRTVLLGRRHTLTEF